MVWIILFLFVFGLVYITQKESQELEDELKKEDDRLAKIRSLYPEPLSYEERMGVKYGPTKPSDE